MAHKAHHIAVSNQIGKAQRRSGNRSEPSLAAHFRNARCWREQAIAQGHYGAIGIGLEARHETTG